MWIETKKETRMNSSEKVKSYFEVQTTEQMSVDDLTARIVKDINFQEDDGKRMAQAIIKMVNAGDNVASIMKKIEDEFKLSDLSVEKMTKIVSSMDKENDKEKEK